MTVSTVMGASLEAGLMTSLSRVPIGTVAEDSNVQPPMESSVVRPSRREVVSARMDAWKEAGKRVYSRRSVSDGGVRTIGQWARKRVVQS